MGRLAVPSVVRLRSRTQRCAPLGSLPASLRDSPMPPQGASSQARRCGRRRERHTFRIGPVAGRSRCRRHSPVRHGGVPRRSADRFRSPITLTSQADRTGRPPSALAPGKGAGDRRPSARARCDRVSSVNLQRCEPVRSPRGRAQRLTTRDGQALGRLIRGRSAPPGVTSRSCIEMDPTSVSPSRAPSWSTNRRSPAGRNPASLQDWHPRTLPAKRN